MNRPAILSLLALTLLPGCRLFQQDLAQTTIRDLQDLKGEMTQGTDEIATVTEALSVLTTEGGDMRKEYEAFSDALEDLEEQSEDVEQLRVRIAAHREEYLNLWQEQLGLIRSPELRERSSQRRNEVVERFNDLRGNGEKIRGSFDKWLQTLQDIRIALKFDLNDEGIAAVSRVSDRASKEALSLVESIESFEGSLDELVKTLDASKPPAPSPDGAQ